MEPVEASICMEGMNVNQTESTVPQTLCWTTVWSVLLLITLSANQAFAQKSKPKPPPPPPSPSVVTTQEIVYSTLESLVLTDKDGSNRVVITTGHRYNVPSWHPDGDEIIFSSAVPEPAIWSIKLNRGSLTGVSTPIRLVPQTMWGGLTTPVWSPLPIDFKDGSAPRHVIAYADRPTGKTNLNIFIWDPGDPTTPARAINLTEDADHWESYPTWSPLLDNGKMQLAVVHTTATGDYPYDLKLLTIGVGADCEPTRIICVFGTPESLVRRISPDPGASTPDCYVPAGFSEPSPLCGPTTSLLRPKFGNTGEAIALGGDIWIVPMDVPAEAYNLIEDIVNFPSGSHPSWSPDDRQIIYRGSIGSKRTVCGRKNWSGVVKINTDGSPFSNGCFVEFIIDGPGQDPSWWRFAP